jgi:signal transduction histidine kinase
MWLFALFICLAGVLQTSAFWGISLSISYLILINPPTLWILKRSRSQRLFTHVSILINVLEVAGYSAIIFFSGGIEATYLTPIYAALIMYVGAFAPLKRTFFLTGICAAAFSFIVAAEGVGLIFPPRINQGFDPAWSIRIAYLSVAIGLLFVVAGISAYTAAIRNRSRVMLEQRNLELEEQKKLLAEAKMESEKTNKAKSEFLANMSHELRTPLNHIIGFTDLVLSRNYGDLNTEQEEFLEDVQRSGHHLLSLINDVLDLSKVEAGKMELEVSEVRIRELLKSSIVMVKEKALKHSIRLAMDVDEAPERILADERKLKQVMYNLLSNAVKFTPDGGEVRLGAKILEGSEVRECHLIRDKNGHSKWMRVWVSDTGLGIKHKDLARIFDPFEQVEGSASRKYQGTGLGLALTRRMVELHGGAIWAESDGIGKGSTFRFAIPVRIDLGVDNDCLNTSQAGTDSYVVCSLGKRDPAAVNAVCQVVPD